MNFAPRRDDCEVVVIGAGPYGLAVAAHLKAAGVATRAFGQSMSAWRERMPKGMKLQSPSAPATSPIPKANIRSTRLRTSCAPAQDQLPLEHFVRYGEWFQRQTVPDLDNRKVTRVEDVGKGFCLALDNGEAIRAPRIVIAMGLTGQDPARRIRRLAVVSRKSHQRAREPRGLARAARGGGRARTERLKLAALLREAGSEVDIICAAISAGASQRQAHAELARLAGPACAPSAVGPRPLSLLNELPGAEHLLPAACCPGSTREACGRSRLGGSSRASKA